MPDVSLADSLFSYMSMASGGYSEAVGGARGCNRLSGGDCDCIDNMRVAPCTLDLVVMIVSQGAFCKV